MKTFLKTISRWERDESETARFYALRKEEGVVFAFIFPVG